MELTLERGYDRVTVQDILDKADVGRSTFYAHYRDKDDLLVSEFEALHPSLSVRPGGLDAGPAGTVGFLEPLRGAFRDAEADRRRYKAFVGRQGSDAVRRLLPEPLVEHGRASTSASSSPTGRVTSNGWPLRRGSS